MRALSSVAKVLIACEESQEVTKAMRAIGVDAFSCDVVPCSGGHPEWHIQCDVVDVLYDRWDMVIAFPPCTHLASSGAAWFGDKRQDGRQRQGVEFFLLFANCRCGRVAIENPVGVMSRLYRKPDQVIHPWQFGDEASKATCLWLNGLPKLVPTNVVDRGAVVEFGDGQRMRRWYYDVSGLKARARSKARSKTFPGIAKAMADQRGRLV